MYTLRVAFVFSDNFFREFCQNVDSVFLEIAINPPLPNKKKPQVVVSFYSEEGLGLHNFQIENRKTELGKPRQVPPRDYSWTSSEFQYVLVVYLQYVHTWDVFVIE